MKHRVMTSAVVSTARERQALAKDTRYLRQNPYTYSDGRYPHLWLSSFTSASQPTQSLPRVVYGAWTGANEVTPRRLRSIEVTREHLAAEGIEYVLLTPEIIPDYVLPEAPLHPAYDLLSYVHRSDYLRGYMMLHHGGGWLDIKEPRGPWKPAFDALETNPELWVASYPEAQPCDVVQPEGLLGDDVRRNYYRLGGMSAFIHKAGNPLAEEWMREVNHRLDYFYENLRDFRSRNGGGADVAGKESGYPIPWNRILGAVVHPLQLKYMDRLLLDPRLRPDVESYRDVSETY